MVGRTRLYQSLGSPLIRGNTRPPGRRWPYVLLVIALLIAAVAVYLVYVR